MSRTRPAFLSFASGTSPGVSAASETGLVTSDGNSNKLPMLTRPVTMRNNITAFLGEFVGTFLFLFFAFAGTQVANTPAPSGTLPDGAPAPPNLVAVLFISLAFGVSLTANVWAFYRITGGLFNPCVTLALALVGGLPALRSAVVVVAQLLAGIAAAGIVSALFPGPLTVNTTLGGGASTAQGLFIEMFLTAELVFVIIMLAAEKHKGTYLAPVGIGTAFFLAELTGVYFTGGSLNPARSLGPAVVNGSFPSYFWIYFLGPVLGALLASGFYALLKYLRWKECNPGQDWSPDRDVDVEVDGDVEEGRERGKGAAAAAAHEGQQQGGSSGNGLLAD
ncbi:aquaporin-like protein [Schizothecium vesticola]|uniref:Aquaporin-like protein n=1 Tax=Schizothecium vesticola TaxID=314040 RepID=A0AA40F0X5_9PEZI|nr:aquaporin-like protein [Schizothecium vesticola]